MLTWWLSHFICPPRPVCYLKRLMQRPVTHHLGGLSRPEMGKNYATCHLDRQDIGDLCELTTVNFLIHVHNIS